MDLIKDNPIDIKKLDNTIKKFDYVNPELTRAYFIYMLAHQKVIGRIESYLSRFEVTSTQISILLLLSVEGNEFLTPGIISKKLGISNPTISNVIKTLNKKKFLKKEISMKDRRYCNISITQAGTDFLNKVMYEYHFVYEKLLENFNDKELKYLNHNSLKLFSNLDSL